MKDDDVHHDRVDYADGPAGALGLVDRLFLGIYPIHFVFLALVPCWWALAPAGLGWAALGSMVCRHPVARRNAVILFGITAAQMAVIGAAVVRVVGLRSP
jgi:hypothetical protein